MRYVVLILAITPFLTKAQEISFSLDIPADTFLMDNVIEISYSLKNVKGWNLEVDDFEDFQVISGPNFSSNFSMINGESSQSQSMNYYVRPKDNGKALLPGARVETEEGLLEVQALEVIILPNPENKEIDYRLGQKPDMNFDFRPEAPKKKKPKRKIYKI